MKIENDDFSCGQQVEDAYNAPTITNHIVHWEDLPVEERQVILDILVDCINPKLFGIATEYSDVIDSNLELQLTLKAQIAEY